MHEKVWRRHPEEWTAGASAPAPGTYPARFHQSVDRTLPESHPPYLFDLGAGGRLMVGDYCEGLARRACQFPDDGPLNAQSGGEIRCGAKRPAAGETNKVHAASGVVFGELVQ